MLKKKSGHTDYSFIQFLGVLSIGVIELCHHNIKGSGICTFQDEMLQEPEI